MPIKLRLRWLRYHFVFRGISWLPAGLAYFLVIFVGRLDSITDVTGRNAYQHGLLKIFPEWSTKKINGLWRSHCEMMARETLDIFLLPRLTRENCDHVIDLHGLDVLDDSCQQKTGVILALAHYGRPTLLSTRLGLSGRKIGMLTQIIDERNPNINSVEREYLAFKMKHTMNAAGGRWITLGDSMRSIYSGLRAGEIIIVLFDLYEGGKKNTLNVPFLGGELTIPRSIERMAAKTGSRIVYGVAGDKGRLGAIELRQLPSDPQEALMAAVVELEKDIRNTPWQWWQWKMLDHIWKPQQSNDNGETIT